MKFLRKATAAGLAGCMLLTAALPETAALAVYGDFTSVTQMATSTPEFTAGDLTFSLFENYAEVKECAKEATEVVIPAEVEGLPVTSIGSLAFSDCPSLTSISIPDSVTSIGEYAFRKCTSLADITIPDGATSIGGRAFNDTPWLAAQQKKNQFVIVNGILIDGTTCTGDVTIPDSVKSIGEFAFYSCKAITSVTIPDGVTSIGKDAFTICLALTSVNIPDSVVSIGENAFARCEALPSVTIPDSVTSIDKHTFSACKAFTDFTVPANVTSIAQSAFYGSTSLTSVTILNPDCAIHDEETTFPETAVIKGYSNSSAQAYAKKYNRTFESLGDAPQAAESVTGTYTFTMPLSNVAGAGEVLTFPFEIVNDGGAKIDKIEYTYEASEDFKVIKEEIIPETKYSKEGRSLLLFRVQVADDVKLETNEFVLRVSKIMDADGNDLTDGMDKTRPSVTTHMTAEPYKAGDTSLTLAQGEKKSFRLELVADADVNIGESFAGGRAMKPGDAYSIMWDEWDKRAFMIDGKQHLFMRVWVTAEKNGTPDTYHESFDMSSFFKDVDGNKVAVTAPDVDITVTAAENVTEPVTDPVETEAATEAVSAPAVDPEVAFKSILDMFRKNVSEGWANFDGKTAEGMLNSDDLTTVSPLWLDTYKDKTLDEVGYSYIDGVLSIIVKGGSGCVDGYAIKDGKIIHLCSAGEKTAYKISGPYIETIVLDEATDASQDTSYDLVDGALVPESARKQDKDGKYYRTEEFTLQKDGSYVYNWQEVDSSKYNTWRAYRAFQLTMLSEGMEQAETVVPTEAATEPKTEPVTDPTEAATASAQIYNLIFPKAVVKQGGSKEIKLSIRHDTTAKYIKSIKAGSYTADGLTFTWKAMDLEDKENTLISIPVTVTAAADAATGNHKYSISLENVLVNEDGEIVPLSSFSFASEGTIIVDAASAATEAVTDPTEPATQPETVPATELTTDPTEPAEPGYEIKVPDGVKVALNKTATVNVEIVRTTGAPIQKIGSGAAGSTAYGLKWMVTNADDADRCVVPITISAKDTAGTYTANLIFAVNDTNGEWSNVTAPLSFTIGEVATEPATAPAVFDTMDLKFGTLEPFTKEIGGAEAAIRVNGLYNVTGPKVLDGSGTADAAIIAELKGYVLEAVQHAVMNTDFTADDYAAHLIEIQHSAADYFAEKGYNEKTDYTLKSIAIASMVVTPVETADDQLYNIGYPELPTLSVGQEYTFDVTVNRKDGKAIGTINGFRKMGEDDAYYASWETVTSDKDTATVKVTLKAEKPFSGEVDLGLAMQIEGVDSNDINEEKLHLTITEAADDQLYNISYPELPTLSVGQEYTFDVTVTRKDGKAIGTINGFRKMGEDDAYYASWETVTSDKDTATVKVTLKAEKPFSGEVDLGLAAQIEGVDINDINEEKLKLTITEAPDDQLYNIGYPEIPALTTGQEYTFDVTVNRKDGKAIGTINGFRKMGEDDAYYASWETVTSDKDTATVKVTLKAEKPFSGKVDLGLAAQIEGVDINDINEEKLKLTITEAAAFDPSKIEGLGDINGDDIVNASDAALILIAAAKVGAGNDSGLTEDQTKRGDLNGDGLVNASDAALVLQYSAMIGAGGEGTLAEYLKAKK